jgi:hypothetical protein
MRTLQAVNRGRSHVSLLGLIYELYATERELAQAYQTAWSLHLRGALPEEARAQLHVHRDRVFALESAVHAALQAALPEAVASQIPAPVRTPDIPPLSQSPQLSQPLSGAPVVVLIWAGVVLVVLLAAVWVWGLVSSIEVAADTSEEFFRTREGTRRYLLEIEALRRRYESCIRRGGSPTDCAAATPVPRPQVPPRPPGAAARPWWVTTLMVAGGVSLVAGGVWVYTTYRKGRALGSLSPYPAERETKSLSGRDVRRALAGGYEMEV